MIFEAYSVKKMATERTVVSQRKEYWMRNLRLACCSMLTIALSTGALHVNASTDGPSEADKKYSPPANTTHATNVYWGDSHLHTGLSLDAGLFGNILGPDDAYRLARGEKITASSGVPVQLARPLDWMVVADHSDMMGIALDIKEGTPNIVAVDKGKEWHEGFNLHRNVIFRDNADKALQVDPATTQPPTGSTDPKYLYDWLEAYESKTGGRVFAFAHNGNLSNGWMFPTDKTYHGGVVDKEYVMRRAKWEPHYEITQIKGDGEAHPALSPEDEFADYENWAVGNLDLSELKTPEMLKGEYSREALKQGLQLEKKFGVNPYKFGVGGGTDSHTALATADEDNFFGKSTSVEPSAGRISHPFIKSKLGEIPGYMLVASGYTGIWAHENTRTALFDAMERKETYATTGPRMMVRFFGGWDFNEKDVYSSDTVGIGYAKGVPMGGDLQKVKGKKAPNFMIQASKDPLSGNLDRVQVIKGWMDKNGETHERVYDVAVSDGRSIDSNGRCMQPVGNTVDLETATWSNSIGDGQLGAVWTDPDFDASESAFYYVRVLEIPTPRWVLYDKVRLGAELPPEAELVAQERAYTSPIWYSPK